MRQERPPPGEATHESAARSGSSEGARRSFCSSGFGALCCRPLIVAGIFLCVSWTGVWLEAPHWARGLGVLALALGLIIALLPLRKFRFPSRKEALGRIDRVSGLASHPAAVIDDRLGNGANDPATRALWNLHRRRAEQAVALLRTGGPSPRMVDLDRYALRASVLVALIATGFVAGPERYARVAAAFDWRFDALARQWLPGRRLDRSSRLHGKAAARLEPWRKPKPSLGSADPQRIEAPSGSIVVIHAPAGNLDMDIKGALIEARKGQSQRRQQAARPPRPPAAKNLQDG